MTVRGAFFVLVALASLGCGIGFLVTGAVAVPALAGWGLVAGSALVAALVSPRAGWFPVALPPLAMATVILVLGQVTLIGARPTVVRELAMVASNLTAMAPAQVASVVLIAGAVLLRRRAERRSSSAPAGARD